MRSVEPEIRLVARPQLDYDMIAEYLAEVGGSSWLERLDRDQLDNDAQNLAEFAGKMCYRSWEPGLNPNVRRVRDDQLVYLQNILAQSHGSVLEHISFTFVLHNVSRVFTHELVRHRPGTAVSQESLRFVRLADIPFWFPEWAREDEELMKRAGALLTEMEAFQRWMADHFGLVATASNQIGPNRVKLTIGADFPADQYSTDESSDTATALGASGASPGSTTPITTASATATGTAAPVPTDLSKMSATDTPCVK